MKGLLSARGQSFPFTHDLRRLASLCDAIDPSLNLSVEEVVALTEYAVRLRYDNDFWPTREEGAAALTVAERVYAALATIPRKP
jgi:HEPN domain-containing protein